MTQQKGQTAPIRANFLARAVAAGPARAGLDGGAERGAQTRPNALRGGEEIDIHRRRWNRFLAVAVVLIVVLSPLPAASNRGASWMLWSLAIGMIATLYFTALALQSQPRPLRAAAYLPAFLPLAAFFAYAVFQTLPIAAHLPGFLTALPVERVPAELGITPVHLSLAPNATLVGLARMIGSAMFLLLVIETAGRLSRARVIAWSLFFSVLVYAMWVMIAPRFQSDSSFLGEAAASIGTPSGPFINLNSFATYLGMGAILGLALALEPSQARKMHPARLSSPKTVAQLALWVAIGVILVAIVNTQSRMGLFATLVGMAVVWLLSAARREHAGHRSPSWLGALAVLALFLAILLSQGEGLIERAFALQKDAAVRAELYGQVISMILTRPLTGFGLDSFALSFELFHAPPLTAAFAWDMAHSSYLALWSEMGLIFGSIPMLLGAMIVWRLLRLLRHRTHDKALPAAALAILAQVAVHSLVDFSLEIQANVFFLLTVLGLALARRERPGLRLARGEAT
ncbi:O-antigen ligase family protein [Phaeovulum sp.]|uniref:O-antigen ligase family protein n=1 Tax=Phaeovulum sp. TaxID=2934796 RepID=UPI003568D1CE